jgi:hypothetical protein
VLPLRKVFSVTLKRLSCFLHLQFLTFVIEQSENAQPQFGDCLPEDVAIALPEEVSLDLRQNERTESRLGLQQVPFEIWSHRLPLHQGRQLGLNLRERCRRSFFLPRNATSVLLIVLIRKLPMPYPTLLRDCFVIVVGKRISLRVGLILISLIARK